MKSFSLNSLAGLCVIAFQFANIFPPLKKPKLSLDCMQGMIHIHRLTRK